MSVALADALLVWGYRGDAPDAPPVRVICGKDAGDYAWSARLGDELALFRHYAALVTFYGIDPAEVHGAFLAVAEYRAALDRDALPALPIELKRYVAVLPRRWWELWKPRFRIYDGVTEGLRYVRALYGDRATIKFVKEGRLPPIETR